MWDRHFSAVSACHLLDDDKTIIKSTKLKSHIKFAVIIPDFFVATKKSRGVLPSKIDFKDAVFNVGHASMFQAAMLTCDMKALEIGVKDKLHQQYRKSYVDGMEDIFEKNISLGFARNIFERLRTYNTFNT